MRQRETHRTLAALACCIWLGSAAAAPASAPAAPPEPTAETGRTRDRRGEGRETVRDHRGESARPPVRDHRSGSTRPPVRDHRDSASRPQVRDHRVIVVRPDSSDGSDGREDAEELLDLTPRGPILGSGDFPLTTILDDYWAGSTRHEFYYLPRAFHLARNPAGGYGVSAVWTTDQKVLLTLTLRADVDPAEVEYAQRLVREKEGASARLLPLPYDSAEIVDLETLEGWEIDEIRVPSTGSLNTSIPLTIEMEPDSFANLKPLLETEGIGAGFVVKSGEQRHQVDVKISLRYPSGRAYSPIHDVHVGYDRGASELVLDGVTNRLDFPVTVDAVDIELADPEWPEPEVYSGLRLASPVVLEPRETGQVVVRLPPSEHLSRKLGLGGGGRGDDESFGEALLREAVTGWLESRRNRGTEDDGEARDRARERHLLSLDGLALRYRLRITPDYSCQECYDRIWGDLEVVSYVERLQRLRIEVLEAAFADSYSGRALDRVKVDVRSPYLSPHPDDRAHLRSVSLTAERSADDSVAVYLPPATDEPLTYEYRLTAILADGTRIEGARSWRPMEESLEVLIGAADIRRLDTGEVARP